MPPKLECWSKYDTAGERYVVCTGSKGESRGESRKKESAVKVREIVKKIAAPIRKKVEFKDISPAVISDVKKKSQTMAQNKIDRKAYSAQLSNELTTKFREKQLAKWAAERAATEREAMEKAYVEAGKRQTFNRNIESEAKKPLKKLKKIPKKIEVKNISPKVLFDVKTKVRTMAQNKIDRKAYSAQLSNELTTKLREREATRQAAIAQAAQPVRAAQAAQPRVYPDYQQTQARQEFRAAFNRLTPEQQRARLALAQVSITTPSGRRRNENSIIERLINSERPANITNPENLPRAPGPYLREGQRFWTRAPGSSHSVAGYSPRN